MRSCPTLRTEICVRASDAMTKIVQSGTVAGAKLRQSGAGGARKEFLIDADERRMIVKNPIRLQMVDVLLDDLRMKRRERPLEVLGTDRAVHKKRFNVDE